MTEAGTVAIIGGGVIGAGWAARFLRNGFVVLVHDPAPDAERKLEAVLANAELAHARLTMAGPTSGGSIRFVASMAEAVEGADLIQESAPEREDLKTAIYAEIERHARPDALICSSTSGLLPSRLQSDMAHPERFLVAHPFNPVYLLPLVELCGGKATDKAAIERASALFKSVGMRPLIVRKEIDGFIADRLMEALWREALWLVNDDIATTEEIDDAVRFGCGLRWALMGTFQTYWLAGGEGGMRHMLAQFGPALKWPWSKLTDVPDLTDELIDTIAEQCDAQARGASPRELERLRDRCLAAIMQGLRTENFAAGETLHAYEEILFDRAVDDPGPGDVDISQPLRLVERQVPAEWVDYNNHMTESRYVHLSGEASDAVFHLIGIDKAYRGTGRSYYTVESHVAFKREVPALARLSITTQILGADDKRLHMFHRLDDAASGTEIATVEQLSLHVDREAGKAVPVEGAVAEKLKALAEAQSRLPSPESAGHGIRFRKAI